MGDFQSTSLRGATIQRTLSAICSSASRRAGRVKKGNVKKERKREEQAFVNEEDEQDVTGQMIDVDNPILSVLQRRLE